MSLILMDAQLHEATLYYWQARAAHPNAVVSSITCCIDDVKLEDMHEH